MKNTTKFSKEAFLKYNFYVTRRIIYQLIFLDLCMCGFAFLSYSAKNYVLMIIALCFALFATVAILVYRKIKIKSTAEKSKEKYNDMVSEYEFLDDKMNVNVKNGDLKNNTVVNYYSLFKVIENPTHYFLMINAREAYIVAKDGFENKEEEKKTKELFLKFAQRYVVKK